MLSCVPDIWLSETTGLASYKVSGEGGVPEVRFAMDGRGDGFFFSRIPVTEIGLVKDYAAAGFSLVDTNVTLEVSAASTVPGDWPGIEVRPAEVDDHPAIQAVAESAFIYSRFHLDPLFPDAMANRIKREWIRSYCEAKRGDALFVAHADGKVAGFLAALKIEVDGRPAAVIDLIAVDETVRGRVMAHALVARFQAHYRSRAKILRVGTQVANTASLGLYQRCGFAVVEASYVLHAHRRDGVFL